MGQLGAAAAQLPVFGLGHSLGSLIHLLISVRYAVVRSGIHASFMFSELRPYQLCSRPLVCYQGTYPFAYAPRSYIVSSIQGSVPDRLSFPLSSESEFVCCCIYRLLHSRCLTSQTLLLQAFWPAVAQLLCQANFLAVPSTSCIAAAASVNMSCLTHKTLWIKR